MTGNIGSGGSLHESCEHGESFINEKTRCLELLFSVNLPGFVGVGCAVIEHMGDRVGGVCPLYYRGRVVRHEEETEGISRTFRRGGDVS